ncbi:MAG: methyltransferase domain-containing protein [Chitinophagaceae bacterium]|nr:methyltransferase domain-containing protein [Chitinophagaceae bacterium]
MEEISYRGSHMRYAENLIEAYKGAIPLHIYLKNYFAANKKHGSKDRKAITQLCYTYFRIVKGLSGPSSIEDIIQTGLSLVINNAFTESYTAIVDDLKKKLKNYSDKLNTDLLFPFKQDLSKEIDEQAFALSFLIQPHLFLRVRPGAADRILKKLKESGKPYLIADEKNIALPNTTNIRNLLKTDREAVIQDYSSGKTIDLLKKTFSDTSELSIWDCCAGSGGKSILIKDTFPNCQLTVSDKRDTILHNLQKRFSDAGIKSHALFKADLTQKVPEVPEESFDVIIADVPCSGSGTWSRTPEQFSFFPETNIITYAEIQKSIIKNVVPKLKKGGYLLYVTCSVFEEENEKNVASFEKEFRLTPVAQTYIKGYKMRADTLYTALLKK